MGKSAEGGQKRIERLRASYEAAERKTEMLRERYGLKGESGAAKEDDEAILPQALLDAVKEKDDAAYKLADAEVAGKTDLEEAFRLLNDLANRGYTPAIMCFARMFEKGHIYERNYTRAFECYEWAEELGDSDASFRIGRMYRLGLGRSVNLKKAEKYFEKAASNGDLKADYQLAVINFELGVPEKGVRLLKKCADRGMKEAKYDYAMCLLHGEGARRDVRKAVQILEECGRNGDEEALGRLRYMYSTGTQEKKDVRRAESYKRT